MHTNRLLRWGGLMALLCGVTGIAGEIAFFFTVGNQSFSVAAPTIHWLVILIVMMLSTLMGLFGLAALYARQAKHAGGWGFVAFIMALAGTMMHFGHQWSAMFVTPSLARLTPDFLDLLLANTATQLAAGVLLTWLLMTLGWLLFGINTLRTRILPAGSAWLVIAGAILSLLLNFANISLDLVVLNAGLVWMGWWLWSEQGQAE